MSSADGGDVSVYEAIMWMQANASAIRCDAIHVWVTTPMGEACFTGTCRVADALSFITGVVRAGNSVHYVTMRDDARARKGGAAE